MSDRSRRCTIMHTYIYLSIYTHTHMHTQAHTHRYMYRYLCELTVALASRRSWLRCHDASRRRLCSAVSTRVSVYVCCMCMCMCMWCIGIGVSGLSMLYYFHPWRIARCAHSSIVRVAGKTSTRWNSPPTHKLRFSPGILQTLYPFFPFKKTHIFFLVFHCKVANETLNKLLLQLQININK